MPMELRGVCMTELNPSIIVLRSIVTMSESEEKEIRKSWTLHG